MIRTDCTWSPYFDTALFFDVLCRATAWTFQFYILNDNVHTQRLIFPFLYWILGRSYRSTFSVICQQDRIRSNSNNCRIATIGPIGSLSAWRRQQQERHKFAYLTMKNNSFARSHVHSSFLDFSKTFSFLPWHEITCFAVVWVTWAYDDKRLTFLTFEALLPVELQDN